MKKLMVTICAVTSLAAFADTTEEVKKEQAKPAAEIVEAEDAPIFWGFANYGIYSGYQLYGSLLNNEPTAQGYAELNANLGWDDLDFGFLGLGVWSNTDLTHRRSDYGVYNSSLGGAFNEWDFNIHWQKTFWIDDNKTWGLTYRSYVVWYYYPSYNYGYMHPATATTFDWDHYIEITNPYLIPYVNCVHEYLQSCGNLFQFGFKKPFQVTDDFSLCPFIEFVARDRRYNWCFPTQFGGTHASGGMATFKLELDANYQLTEHIGLFAKVAYCSIIDSHMRQDCDDILHSDDYGENKDFAWGGVGVSVNF